MSMIFAWDHLKATANRRKHGVSFEDASTAFGDPLSITIPDMLHSRDEHRFVLLGQTVKGELMVVVHLERGDSIRIISARQATPKERRHYEKG